jgi:hypothetical protein
MAGDFDDLIPGSTAKTGGPRGSFDDLIPAEPTPEEIRSQRLRKIARGALGAGGAGDVFGDAFTLGLQKPTAGLAEGLGGMIKGALGIDPGNQPQSFGEGWKAGTGSYSDFMNDARANSGWGGTAAGVAGGLMSGGPARSAVQTGLMQAVKNAGIQGGIQGAAENSDDLESAAKGGAIGAGVGGAAGGILHSLFGMAGRALPSNIRTRRAERLANRGPTPDELKNQARAIYRQLDQGNVAYDNTQSTALANSLISHLNQNGYDPRGAHAVLDNGVVQRLRDLAGQPMSLETLQQIRSQAASNATNPDSNVRRVAGMIMQGIDGFVNNQQPALSSIPPDQVGPLWAQARQLWRTANTADDIGWRLDKATRRSDSTASGTNIDNPIRQNIRSVVDKSTQPGRFNPYSPEELAQMQRVVEGSPLQNQLRSFGNRFGGSGPLAGVQGNTIGGATGIGALLHGAEPTTAGLVGLGTGLGLYGLGKGARMAADRMSEDAGDDLVRLISTGSLARQPAMPFQMVPTRAQLARLMMQQSLEREAGKAAGAGAAGMFN